MSLPDHAASVSVMIIANCKMQIYSLYNVKVIRYSVLRDHIKIIKNERWFYLGLRVVASTGAYRII